MSPRIESDGYARNRYHGQGKRGRPSPVAVAVVDLNHAIDALTSARDGLRSAARMHAGTARDELVAEAQAQLKLGAKFLREAMRMPKAKRAKAEPRQLRLGIR